MKDLMNKISGSKFFKEMKKIFVSIKENENVKNVINGLSNSADNATIPNPFDTFGHYASEKIKKLFKKFGKNYLVIGKPYYLEKTENRYTSETSEKADALMREKLDECISAAREYAKKGSKK